VADNELLVQHTVLLRKLVQFQELGHETILLLNSLAAPTGSSKHENLGLNQQEEDRARERTRTFMNQVWKMLDPQCTRVLYDHDGLPQLGFRNIIGLASNFTVGQFLAQQSFSSRIEKGDPIWLHEFFYALMQAHNASAVDCDVQIGNTDDLLGRIAMRRLAEVNGMRPPIVLAMPPLVGTDGALRMSRTIGNHIGLEETPKDMFGKIMSIPDNAMRNYADLVTRWTPEEIAQRFAALESGQLHPRDLKMQLAWEIVEIFHGAEAAETARQHFHTVFQQRELPPDMPELKLQQPVALLDLLADTGVVLSRSEVRRLVQQGGIKLDGHKVEDPGVLIHSDSVHILQLGRRKFLKLSPA
jgi:tyrosyl-tRNA synthetase